MTVRRSQTLLVALVALVAFAAAAATAPGAMRSTKINRNLCKTTGGGKFVAIPGFPGEKVDRRLLSDIEYLVRRYKIFITDGYSKDPVHAANGEHPLGLALDIVPDKSRGGSWKLISRLAKRAEPTQNQPIAPWRWVGYNGDAGHGCGNHLHLSWQHAPAAMFQLAEWVEVMDVNFTGVKGAGRKKPESRPKAPAGPPGGVSQVNMGGVSARPAGD